MKESTAFKLVKDELDRATDKFGAFASAHEGYAILLEELDELWDEVKAGNENTHRATSEAVQVAAMAIRYLLDICDESTAEAHEEKVDLYYNRAGLGPPGGGCYSG